MGLRDSGVRAGGWPRMKSREAVLGAEWAPHSYAESRGALGGGQS